jgi:hypothetical protein
LDRQAEGGRRVGALDRDRDVTAERPGARVEVRGIVDRAERAIVDRGDRVAGAEAGAAEDRRGRDGVEVDARRRERAAERGCETGEVRERCVEVRAGENDGGGGAASVVGVGIRVGLGLGLGVGVGVGAGFELGFGFAETVAMTGAVTVTGAGSPYGSTGAGSPCTACCRSGPEA